MRIPLNMTEMARQQKCGGCNACCMVLAIAELPFPKPNWQHCPHECNGGGCNIYADKPQECTDYYCSFAEGIFGEDISYRPDKLGLIIDFRGVTDEMFPEYRKEVFFFQAWETRPNARNEKRAAAVIKRLEEENKCGIVIRQYGQPMSKLLVYGTKKMVQEIYDFLAWQIEKAKKDQATDCPII